MVVKRLVISRTAAALICAHAIVVVWIGSTHFPSYDEIGHLPAAVSHWRYGSFEAYKVNPPLARLAAGLGALACKPVLDWSLYIREGRAEFFVGSDFIERDSAKALSTYRAARLACLPFTLLGAYLCYQLGGERGGWAGAHIALFFWCVSPTILGLAAQILPDVAAASMSIATFYCFKRWLDEPSWSRSLYLGGALGLALLAKFTCIILLAILPLLAILHYFLVLDVPNTQRRCASLAALMGKLCISLTVSIYCVNLCYGFSASLRSLGSYNFRSLILAGEYDGIHGAQLPWLTGNRFRGTFLAAIPVPLPAAYVEGVDFIKWEFEDGKPSYLHGSWRHGGWWYYYLAFADLLPHASIPV